MARACGGVDAMSGASDRPIEQHPFFVAHAVAHMEDAAKLAHALLRLALRLDSIGTQEDAQELCDLLRLVGVVGARPVVLAGSAYWSVRLCCGWCLSPGLHDGQGWLLRGPSDDRPRAQPLTLRVQQLLDLEWAALTRLASQDDKGTP